MALYTQWSLGTGLPQLFVVQLLSHVCLFATPWTAARQASLSWSLLKLMSIESVMLSNHLVICCPLLLPSILSQHRETLFVHFFSALWLMTLCW